MYGPALETDRDCIGATLSSVLSVPNCAVYNGDYMQSAIVNNGSNLFSAVWTAANGGASTTIGSYLNGTDFDSKRNPDYVNIMARGLSASTEEASSTCVGITDCIFDVTSQQ